MGGGGESQGGHDRINRVVVPAISRLGGLDGGALETFVKRVIVLGGCGLFGRTIAEQLHKLGIEAQTASRRSAADLRIDANDRESLRKALRAGDVVIDAAGPFHERSTALIETAVELGLDAIDINDHLPYAESVVALESQIEAAGIRVLSSASTVSAVAAAVVSHSKIAAPRRVTAYLAPASRHTAHTGAALSLIRSVGQPVRLWRNGRLESTIGWCESRSFPMPKPIGAVRGWLFESADSFYLPRIWPTLREVAMFVDTHLTGMNSLLRLAVRSRAIRQVLRRGAGWGSALARRIGSSTGGIGYEIDDGEGHMVRYAVAAAKNSYLAAVAPAVVATRAIVNECFPDRGLVRPDRHVEPEELFEFLRGAAVEVRRVE
jgi:saccharopine dehydrogenase-like NADP-dependent oxidoreductase